jgi:hypothetical protein
VLGLPTVPYPDPGCWHWHHPGWHNHCNVE